MSNSSDSCSPVASAHTSLGDEEGDAELQGWSWEDSLDHQLKVLEPSDQMKELQTIIRDR